MSQAKTDILGYLKPNLSLKKASKKRKFTQRVELILNLKGLNLKKPEEQVDEGGDFYESEKEQEEYYQVHPNNVIRLILGKKKTGDTDWDNRYTRAADYLRRWESDGIIIRASKPAIYLTSLTYRPQDSPIERTRWGFIALTRIEEESSGVILPHERTFSAHKDDRLRLLRACNTQFSQIFGLYEDDHNEMLDACKAHANDKPVVSFEFKDGTKHSMWILSDPSLFRLIRLPRLSGFVRSQSRFL